MISDHEAEAAPPDDDSHELTDDELDDVAGGSMQIPPIQP